MFRLIHSPTTPVTLVGGGEASPGLVNVALHLAPTLVAADGGARLAREAGAMPEAVIGDFDSLGALDIPKDRLHHRPDQNATDFDKCLAEVDAPLFLAVGFLGGRLDHQLASMTTILREPRPVILMSGSEIAFIAPRRIALDLPPESPCSLYPLIPAILTTRGLRYPLTAAKVAPDGLTSTSNHVKDGPVMIETDRHAVLVTLPLQALGIVCDALLQ